MKHLTTPITLGVSLLLASTGLAFATNVHEVTHTKGQPNQTIGSDQTGSATPGNASSARGSAFNPDGIAGTHYAGTQPQNTKTNGPDMTHVVAAQYDVAGFQQSHNH